MTLADSDSPATAPAERMAATRPRLVVDSHCELGEGVLWDVRDGSVLWTDIAAAKLWRHAPATNATRCWHLHDRLASFALCESGRLLLALAKGLYFADPLDPASTDPLRLEWLARIEPDQPLLRCNDGRADRNGNFVFGTLNEDTARAPLGRYYQYSMRHGLRPLDLGGVAIPNSLCFDLDGRGMYYCDTLQGRIMHCRYDAETARVGPPEVFADVEPPGAPDGAAIDRHGRLWSAHWGAARVVCYGRDGRVEQRITLPSRQPSCVAFGGDALDALYVTTARESLAASDLAHDPFAGGLYRIDLGEATGLPESRFDDR